MIRLSMEANKGINRMFRLMLIGIITLMALKSSVCAKEIIADNNIHEEFQLSESEKRDVVEFLDQMKAKHEFDLNYVLEKAFDGNPIAMYIAGQCSLLGAGTTINREAAHLYFEMAASLGYPPALYEISRYYACEQDDPLLALVYLNLTISNDHREYRDFYYQQTQYLAKVAGQTVVKEVERIALEKTIEISDFIAKIEKSKNTPKPGLSLIGMGITSCDCVYTEAYWKRFFKSEEHWTTFFFGTKQEDFKKNINS